MSKHQTYEIVQTFEFVSGPARIYRSQDALHQVVVSDAQADEWEQIRDFNKLHQDRLAPEAVQSRQGTFWPDDVFAAIKRLPNPELVTEVVLQNESQASSLASSKEGETAEDGGTSAQTFLNGRIVFKSAADQENLTHSLLLAWSRLLWYKYEVLSHFFRYAALIERSGYFIASATNDMENWTIHLAEGVLAQDEDRFLTLVEQAPLRTVILASALQRTLDDYNENPHPDLEKRIQIVTDRAILKAQESLLTAIKSGGNDESDAAFKLLLLLGTEAQLASLSLTVANLANEPHTNAVLGKLGAVKTLEDLNLSQTLISREGTQFLANLSNLCKLDLSDTKVMSSSLYPLRSLGKLEELNLSGTQINDSSLPSLGQLSSLKRLDIQDTELASSKQAIEKLLPNCLVLA